MQFQKTSSNLLAEPSQPIKNQFAFAFTCEPDDILDLFEEISLQLGFELIERQTTFSTAIKKPVQKKGILNIMNCFGCWNIDGVTAIKISLSKHSKKGKLKDSFVAQVKGLVGINDQISSFLSIFSQSIVKQGFSLGHPKVMLQQDHDFLQDFSQNQTPYYLQACSYHLINNLIINEKYDISSSAKKMLEDYSNTFKNLQESVGLVPLPMKNAISIVNELKQKVQKLMAQLKYPKEINPYLRISVQNYIFNKIQNQLFSIYRIRNLSNQTHFQQKKLQIISSYSIQEMISEVCLSQKFWSFNKKRKEEILAFQQLKRQIYFGSVCKQFEKMVFTNSPRQKIKYCQLGYTELKNHFYDYSSRKYQVELSSMEDIIPVLIIIVLLLEIGQLRSEFDIMLDFINFDPNEMEAEKRLLINLSESYNYIYRDWILKK